jgi:two-component system nitrogen regulation response regulator NtrX
MAKILVIDDERAIRNSLKDILEYENHEVLLMEDGMHGLDEVIKNEYEIVLCDIKMPGMDGIEVLEKAREMETDARFIMISGHGKP